MEDIHENVWCYYGWWGRYSFWPLSRATAPKQFLNITGEDSMINDTIKRIKDIIPPERIIIVTNKAQEKMLKEVVQENIPKENVLIEPVGRNTAACIGYAAMVIKKRCNDAVMGVFPSDHYIKNVGEFQRVLKAASSMVEDTENLVTMGINPTFPSTGYGYIKYDRERSIPAGDKIAYEVVEFVEKPDIPKAKAYWKAETIYGIVVCLYGKHQLYSTALKGFYPGFIEI